MKDSLSTQLEPIVKPISKFLWRFHVMIYTVIVIGGVAVSVFLLSGLLLYSPDDVPQDAKQSSFDKKTIDAIREFQSPNSSIDTFSLPATSRSNPFVE